MTNTAREFDMTGHEMIRILDALDRNGPMTFAEVCEVANVDNIPLNQDLYREDDMGAPYNDERMIPILYRITTLGRSIIRHLRGGKGERTIPEREEPTAEIGGRFQRVFGDPAGRSSESAGAICTVKGHKDRMVWYIYDDQKEKWTRCSKPMYMPQDQFSVAFKPLGE